MFLHLGECLLKKVELDNEREKEARDIFLLEVYTGQRIGDLPKIFKGGQTQVKNGYEFLPIMTQKENKKSAVLLLPETKELVDKYQRQGGFKKMKIESWSNTTLDTTVDALIKRVAQKAGLNNEEIWYEERGGKVVEKKAPFYKIISTHYARYTFITNMLKRGITTERLSYFTGHTSDEMIRTVYSDLKIEDKMELAAEELGKTEKNGDTIPNTERKKVDANEKGTGAIKALLNELGRFEHEQEEEKKENGFTPSWIEDDLSWKSRISYNGFNAMEDAEAYVIKLDRLYNAFQKSAIERETSYLKRLLAVVKEMREKFELDVLGENFDGSIKGMEIDLQGGNKNVMYELTGLRWFQKMTIHQRYYFEKVEEYLRKLITE